MSARRRQRGFTLLELLITLAVTTIGLLGLLSLHVSVARGNEAATRSSEATQIANATLEQLRAAQLTSMVQSLTGNPLAGPPIDVTLSTQTGRAGMTYRRRVVITQAGTASSLWRIRVEVGWTEDGAGSGASGGNLDHLIAAELVRTVEEGL